MTAPRRPGTPRRTVGSSTPANRRGPSSGQLRTVAQSRQRRAARQPTNAPTIAAAPRKRSIASLLTIRTAVLVLVLALAAAVLVPSMRVYFAQQDELQGLREEQVRAEKEVTDLEAELARWADNAYIVAQARERLNYVFPGEVPYKVVDPETVEPTVVVDPVTGTIIQEAEPVWFEEVWNSFSVAGGVTPDQENVPAPAAGSAELGTNLGADSSQDDLTAPLDVDYGG